MTAIFHVRKLDISRYRTMWNVHVSQLA